MEFAELITSPNLDRVILQDSLKNSIEGTLCITGHHLILSSRNESLPAQEVWLLHQCIDNIEKKLTSSSTNSGGIIIIKCKDFRIFQLIISNTEDLLNVFSSIERLINLDKTDLLYPFFYRPLYNILEDGHTCYKPEIEFSKLLQGDEWRLSHINSNYSVCSSYGATLVVPKSIDDETISAAASFREGGRFPILSYKHENGAVLLRSSQPMLNNSNRRCRADENILNAVLGQTRKGYIIDTRSTNYTNNCKAKGGGTEPEGHYTQWKKVHKPMDKISKCNGSLLDNLAKLIDACNDSTSSSDKWLSRLESSNWLTHVLNVLNGSCLVAQCLAQDGATVLVHGSTGLDSTLLLTSIAQIILNPDCRTVRGLQALIEREWLQGGHPFQLRNSKFCFSNSRSKYQQPTFLLFLDCVQQLHYQFPCSFEFNTDMLILLFEHSYFSQFGTFLGNCEQDRVNLKLAKQTTSLWSYLNRPDVLTSVLNPLYEPNKGPIWPSVAPVSLVLWRDLYLRWVVTSSTNKVREKVGNILEKHKEIRSQVIKLRKTVAEAQEEYDELKRKSIEKCDE
ncbi:myotubularin-related protein 9 [Harmonia axyridis]|uniref:myotubularin-related protein 9 n=1 Tax=Harmonia axyridis TaxID=115357 RepID=UPI001E277494|nr:myotubularin-related protein 9 [Harmonia axyridis]